jgi:phosphoribosylformylglycinamidine synthase
MLVTLMASPNLCSRRAIFEQYDHMVQTNTVVPPGQGAAVLRVKGTQKALVLGLGGNPRVCAASPRTGGAMAVAEACRNVACAGARPLAITDCLNFGDPERPAVWRAMTDVVDGMSDACRALEAPVISGNVSLYNETDGAAIPPTPIVGALGLIEDVDAHARAALVAGDEIWLIGPLTTSLAASEYAAVCHAWTEGTPAPIDLELERKVQDCVRTLIANGAVHCATDASEGGLAVALAELALAGGLGIRGDDSFTDEIRSGRYGRLDQVLFGEAASRVIVGIAAHAVDSLKAAARQHSVPIQRLGHAADSRIAFEGLLTVPLGELQQRWETALDRLMGG